MDDVVKLWSVPGWEQRVVFAGHARSVNCLALSPDGKTLATGSSDATVRLWSFPGAGLLRTMQDRKKAVAAVAFSPDGAWIATGSYGGRVMVWTVAGEDVVGFKANDGNLSLVAFSPDGKVLATAGLGGRARVWSLPGGKEVATLAGDDVASGSLAFVEGGNTLVSLGHGRTVRFWDTRSWQQARVEGVEEEGVRGLVLSADERLAAIALEGKVQDNLRKPALICVPLFGHGRSCAWMKK
jgi:WD40 repeat protein